MSEGSCNESRSVFFKIPHLALRATLSRWGEGT
jgi:hypothetical protein